MPAHEDTGPAVLERLTPGRQQDGDHEAERYHEPDRVDVAEPERALDDLGHGVEGTGDGGADDAVHGGLLDGEVDGE